MNVVLSTPCLVPDDAVGNDVLLCRDELARAGVNVLLWAEERAGTLADLVTTADDIRPVIARPDTVWIYHHSVGWNLGQSILATAGCRVILKYHHVTPSRFFAGYDDRVVRATRRGRRQTVRFATSTLFESYACDSEHNAEDLRAAGAPHSRVHVVPPFHRLAELSSPDARRERAPDAPVHALFVGRFAPNKGHRHALGVAAEYLARHPGGLHLTFAGVSASDSPYLRELRDDIATRGLEGLVTLRVNVPFDEIRACYAGADVFLCMSEHEGFCVPILEAQQCGVPVVALGWTAVRETVGEGGIVLDTIDAAAFAGAVRRVASDRALAASLRAAGRRNLVRFTNEQTLKKTLALLTP